MATRNKDREMRIAIKRVEGFAKEFGEAHPNLARHAAFPLVLTPDLLYQIWANFVPEAPWSAVAMVLLSRLCREVGYEMYQIDICDCNLLLRELKAHNSREQIELQLSGLVVKRDGNLRLYNPIYEDVFNQAWIEKEIVLWKNKITAN